MNVIVTFRYLTVSFIILMMGVQNALAANDELHGASNIVLLQHACPIAWEKVDKAISPRPTTVPWANETDRHKHITFQKNFILPQTKTGARDLDSVSRDVITVLSECIKRHNLVVKAEFGKTVGKIPTLKEKVDISAILQILLMMDD